MSLVVLAYERFRAITAIHTINKIFLVLILVNSCANHIVYALQSTLFRKQMVNILCLCQKLLEIEEIFYSFQKMERNYKYI